MCLLYDVIMSNASKFTKYFSYDYVDSKTDNDFS
jgi:hypothetical protein